MVTLEGISSPSISIILSSPHRSGYLFALFIVSSYINDHAKTPDITGIDVLALTENDLLNHGDLLMANNVPADAPTKQVTPYFRPYY